MTSSHRAGPLRVDTLLILVLLAGGLGLVARSLRPQGGAAAGTYSAAE